MSRLLLFLILALVATACSVRQASWAGVSEADGEIYVSYGKFIAKVDSNGKRDWTYPAEDDRGAMFFNEVTVIDDIVYVGDYKGAVHAIDRETGDKKFIYQGKEARKLFGFINFGGSTDRVLAPITVTEEKIYVPDEHGIFVLEWENDKLVKDADWNFEVDRAVWSQPIYLPAGDEHPAQLYVTALNHSLYSLNPDTGEKLWQVELGGAAPGGPSYDSETNTLFIGTLGKEMLAIDAATGEIVARYETEAWVWGKPALVDNTLYFGDLDANLYALAFRDSKFEKVWSKSLDESKIRATPLLADHLLIVSTEGGNVYGINREDGVEEWKAELERPILSTLIQVESTSDEETEQVVVVSTDNPEELLIALRLDNGNKRWTYKHED